MVSEAENKTTSKKIGYLRLAMVTFPTAVIVALGIGVIQATAPSAGQTCSKVNATIHYASGRTMSCNPTMAGSDVGVWQDAPGS